MNDGRIQLQPSSLLLGTIPGYVWKG